MGELREIWLIRSNFPGFSVDGQKSETSQLNMGEFSVKCTEFVQFVGYVGELGKLGEFCLIRWNFREFFATGQASET